MYFKILNAREKNDVLLVSGCFFPENVEDREILAEYIIAFDKLSEVCGSDYLSTNTKTIIFKSVPINTLYDVLKFQNTALSLNLKLVFSSNMKDNIYCKQINDFFSRKGFFK